MSDVSSAFSGSTKEEAQVSSVLMVGARKDPIGRLLGINQSIISRFLGQLDRMCVPQSQRLEAVKNNPASGNISGVIKTIDINFDYGGVDLYSFNAGDNPPDAIVLCGIPRYPNEYLDDVSEVSAELGELFSYSHDYQHDEDNWYNLRKKIQDLEPKFLFCAGGSDCLSWQECIGPDFIAINGLEQGLLVSRQYLANVSAYLMQVESPLLEAVFGDGIVYDSSDRGLEVRSRVQPGDLWPITLS